MRDPKKIKSINKEALRLIVEEGFDGFSMQKVAKAANVSPATLYIYFENKEDLINQLYNDIHASFVFKSLENFDVHSTFREGLWCQWKNRLSFIKKEPLAFSFLEQFRHSPLIQHDCVRRYEFKDAMRTFLQNCVERGEISPLPPEVFWSVAYAPFYSLIKFDVAGKSLMNDNFKLKEKDLLLAFELVLQAFTNQTN